MKEEATRMLQQVMQVRTDRMLHAHRHGVTDDEINVVLQNQVWRALGWGCVRDYLHYELGVSLERASDAAITAMRRGIETPALYGLTDAALETEGRPTVVRS